MLGEFGILALPTMLDYPARVGVGPNLAASPVNLAGHPAMSVPVGLDESGLPIGFQILAPALGEQVMFRVAAEVERLARFEARPAMVGALA